MRDDYAEYGYHIIIQPVTNARYHKNWLRIWALDADGTVVYSTSGPKMRQLRNCFEQYVTRRHRQMPDLAIPFPPPPPDPFDDM